MLPVVLSYSVSRHLSAAERFSEYVRAGGGDPIVSALMTVPLADEAESRAQQNAAAPRSAATRPRRR